MTYVIRTVTEDGEIDSSTTLSDLGEAEEEFDVVSTYTFDTESHFYPDDPFWVLQLIDNDSDAVLRETNSILESKGLAG